MSITIIGYYGSNFGDLLMLKSLIENLNESTINILTYGKKNHLAQQNFIQCRSIKIVEINTASKLEIFKIIQQSESMIWGGGTCFMDEGGTGGIKYMLLAKLLGCKIFYAGIGVDNHRKLSTKIYMILASLISKYIYVRDNESIKYLKKLNPFSANKIIKTSDLAYACDFDCTDTRHDQRLLVYCPRNLDHYKHIPKGANNRILEVVAKSLKELNLNKIIILNADASEDTIIAQQALEHFRSSGIESQIVDGSDLSTSIAALTSCKFLITVRLHPAVVALEHSIPFAIYNYSDKNKKFTEESNQKDRLIEACQIESYTPNYNAPKPSTHNNKHKAALQMIKEIENTV